MKPLTETQLQPQNLSRTRESLSALRAESAIEFALVFRTDRGKGEFQEKGTERVSMVN